MASVAPIIASPRAIPIQPYPNQKPRARELLRAARARILAETLERLIKGEDPDRVVMPALFEALAAERIVDATLGYIVADLEEGMKLGFMEGFDQAMVERCLTLDFGQAICGTVAMTREAMHVTDIQRSLDPMADLVRAAGINAYACEPLIVRGRLLGTLSFASRTRRSFDVDDLIFFRSVAKQVAVARERSRRAAAAEQRRAKSPPVLA